MKVRFFKKFVGKVYDAAKEGDFKSAYEGLQKVNSSQQQKVLTVFNKKAFENLGVENGTNLATNFAAYRGLQKGLKSVGGMNGINERITSQLDDCLGEVMENLSKKTLNELPQTRRGWGYLLLQNEWTKVKKIAQSPTTRFKNYLKNRFSTSPTNTTVKSSNITKNVGPSRNIPSEIKPLLANLEGKTGQEFVDNAYKNIVDYMNLRGIAPNNIKIEGCNGLVTATGGYDPIANTINFSQGFLTNLSPRQQINLIAHELKHCEQAANMLRTEGIGVNGYARALAERNVNQALDDSSFEFMFKSSYERALKNGKGEEFMQKAIDNTTDKMIAEIETNFSEVLKLPKIKAGSVDGIRAKRHLEAQKNYEGLDILGFGSEKYRNNPLENEAYAFGDNIENLLKDYLS